MEKIQSKQLRVQLVIALLNQETLLNRENSVASDKVQKHSLILISLLSFSFLSKLCKNKACFFLPQGARNLAVGELKRVYKCAFSFSGYSYALPGNYSEHRLPFLWRRMRLLSFCLLFLDINKTILWNMLSDFASWCTGSTCSAKPKGGGQAVSFHKR